MGKCVGKMMLCVVQSCQMFESLSKRKKVGMLVEGLRLMGV